WASSRCAASRRAWRASLRPRGCTSPTSSSTGASAGDRTTRCCTPTRSRRAIWPSTASSAAPGAGRSSCAPGSSASRLLPCEHEGAGALPQSPLEDEAIALRASLEEHGISVAVVGLRLRDALPREHEGAVVGRLSARLVGAGLPEVAAGDHELA